MPLKSNMLLPQAIRKYPPILWTMSLALLINRMGTMVMPFMMIYLTKSLKVTASEASLVMGVYGVTTLVASPLSGIVADRIGYRRTMSLSLLLSALTLLIYPYATTLFTFALVTVFFSAFTEAFRPAAMALISGAVPKEQVRTAFTVTRLAINLGMSIGPAVGGILFVINPKLLFYVDGLATFLAFLVLILFRAKNTETLQQRSVPTTNNYPSNSPWRDKHFLLFCAALLPMMMVFFQHVSTLPLYMTDELLLSPKIFGQIFIVNTVLILIFELPINARTGHIKYTTLLVVGAILMAVGNGALVFAGTPSAIAVTIAIWTFGEIVLFPTSSAYVSQLAPAAVQGAYMGVYSMIINVGFILAPLAGVAVYERFGSQILWLATLGMGLVAALIFYTLKSFEKLDNESQKSPIFETVS